VLENIEFEKKIPEIQKRINYISAQLLLGQRVNNYSKRFICWTQRVQTCSQSTLKLFSHLSWILDETCFKTSSKLYFFDLELRT